MIITRLAVFVSSASSEASGLMSLRVFARAFFVYLSFETSANVSFLHLCLLIKEKQGCIRDVDFKT